MKDHKEINRVVKEWLVKRQNSVLYSMKSPCETIEELINEIDEMSKVGEMPWETP